MMMDREPSVFLPATLQSHGTADAERGARKDGETPRNPAPRSYGVERADYRTGNNSPRGASLQTQPQSISHREHINNSKGVGESQRRQPHRPATQGGRMSGLINRYWY
jgi:hypothetical protein